MIGGKKSILFVGHEAYRTGASILLLNMIRWIYFHRDVKIQLLLLDGGPLIEEYQKFAQVRVISKKKSFLSHVQKFRLNLFLKRLNPDFIYFNTVATIKFFQRFQLAFFSFRKVLHVHEMPFSIEFFINKDFSFNQFDQIIAVNQEIEYFIKGREKVKIQVSSIPPFIVLKDNENQKNSNKSKPGKKYILGVGVASWRKGFDLFFQTAFFAQKQFPGRFNFQWVGPISDHDRKRAEYEIMKMGISDFFSIMGELTDINSYYQNADLLFLSSREDPFPLVMLEAAFFRLPVIYFQGTGGAEEFFDYNAFEIPYGDCQAVVERIYNILQDLNVHDDAIEEFHKKAIQCDEDLIIPRILKEIGFDE